MRKYNSIHTILTIAIAAVWLINGFFCKLINLVPRHQVIVARILGEDHSHIYTEIIGALEVLMFVWIISRVKPILCAIIQIIVIATMNLVEFIMAPDLLLFGKANGAVALFFIAIILLNEFIFRKSKVSTKNTAYALN